MSPPSVHRLDRFELIAEIASGGMATVYLARTLGPDRSHDLLAVKRLHPHLAEQPVLVQGFLDEARLASRIHHPNVIRTLEAGSCDAGCYLVMEYVEGETLSGLVARASARNVPLPPRVLARVLLDVLDGLHAAHELLDEDGRPLHLVHRDVSPENVIVGVDGSSRITDFGLARAAASIAGTRDGRLEGSVGYMAPEQARGEAIDRRADVFSVGVILWELLAGRRLFKPRPDTGQAEMLDRVVNAPIPALADLREDVARELSDVVVRALQRAPEARFADCAELRTALETAMQGWCGVASAREVAEFLHKVAGEELAARRAAVRPCVGEPAPTARATRRTLILWAVGVLVLLCALLGLLRMLRG